MPRPLWTYGRPVQRCADRWDTDAEYREHVSQLAHRVWAQPPSPPCTLAEVVEYRAHLVLERLHGTLTETMFDQSMGVCAAMETRILYARDHPATARRPPRRWPWTTARLWPGDKSPG